MKFIIQINYWIEIKKVKMLTSFNLMEKSMLVEFWGVKIWFNQTSCLPNKPHKFEWNFEGQNLVNSNMNACHIIPNIWVIFWVSKFGDLKFAWTCKHDSINRVIMVHESSSQWKTLRKTSHKHSLHIYKIPPKSSHSPDSTIPF